MSAPLVPIYSSVTAESSATKRSNELPGRLRWTSAPTLCPGELFLAPTTTAVLVGFL